MKDSEGPDTAEKVLFFSIEILAECEKGRPLDELLDEVSVPGLHRTITDLLFSYFRNKAGVDAFIREFTYKRGKPQARLMRILKIATVQLIFQSGSPAYKICDVAVSFVKKKYGRRPAGFINAVLRRIADSDYNDFITGSPDNIRMNLPENIFSRWRKSIPDFLETLPEFIHRKPRLSFRIAGLFPEGGVSLEGFRKIELPAWGGDFDFYNAESLSDLIDRGLLENGSVYIQDPSTVAPLSLYPFRNCSVVLDLCSAPGGKTLALRDKMHDSALIVASDVSFFRQRRTLENITAHGADNCAAVTASALTPPFRIASADLVLLDVPCSNTGVFRRRPDVLWNFSDRKLKELISIQKSLLESTAPLVKDSGALIYSTCSIESEENLGQVMAFLDSHQDFELAGKRELFPCSQHDGGFSALLRKTVRTA